MFLYEKLEDPLMYLQTVRVDIFVKKRDQCKVIYVAGTYSKIFVVFCFSNSYKYL